MIKLHLAIYEGDVEKIPFKCTNDLIGYIEELEMFDCIWVATSGGPDSEILITEETSTIINALECDFWETSFVKDSNFFVQEYQTYEEAYSVALLMREENIKCYK